MLLGNTHTDLNPYFVCEFYYSKMVINVFMDLTKSLLLIHLQGHS